MDSDNTLRDLLQEEDMTFFPKYLFLVAALCLAAPGPAAEEKKLEDTDSPAIVETVEVVGNVALNRVVQSVTVHETGPQIPNGQGLKEIFNRTPGFLLLNGGHYGQMAYAFARGAAVNQTLFIIDGVKISDPSSSLGLNLAMISSSLLERAEIVRGPLGSLYGSNAMGGVVNLSTRMHDGVSASAGFGSHGSWQSGVHAAGRFGHWRLSLNADLNRYNDAMQNDEFDNHGAGVRAAYTRGNLEAAVQVFVHTASSGIPSYMGMPSPNRHYDQSSFMAALPVTWTAGKHTQVKLQLSHNTNTYEFNDPDDTWSPFYRNRSQVNEAEVSVTGRFLPGWHFRTGLDAASHTILNQTGDTLDLDNENGGYFSAYAGTNLELGDFLVTLNMRMDKYSDVKAAWSPQLGISFLVTRQIKLRASWGEGFRAPTLPERLNPMWGNPGLNPETSRSLEIGADIYMDRVTLGIVAFDTRYENLIGYSPLTWRYTNLNQAVIRGMEISASFQPAPDLELRTAWTWLHTQDNQYNRQLLRRPEHALSVGFNWTRHRFSLGGEMTYVGKRLDYNELDWIAPVVTSPAFNTFSFHARVALTRQLSVNTRMTNAFNSDYAEVYGYPAPGTRVMAGLSFQTD